MQNVAASSRLIGSSEDGAGESPEEITLGTGLSMSGSTLNAAGGVTDGDKGDVTVSSSGEVWTIGANAVTYGKMQATTVTDVVLGRTTSGGGTIEEMAFTKFGQSLMADSTAVAGRTTLGVAIGTNVQAYDSELDALALLTSTAYGRALLELTDAAALQAVAKPIMRCPFHANATANVTLTNQSATDQFLSNNNRNIQLVDLANYSEVRVSHRTVTNSASAASPRLIARYVTTYSQTVASWIDIGTSEVSSSMASYNIQTSGWVALAVGAKVNDCYLSVIQAGGNGVADPAVASVVVEFR